MTKMTLATVALIGLAISAVAQNNSGQKGGVTTTVQGCVSHSDFGYVLTDTSGTTHQLTGDTAQLSRYVGQEIQISGTTALPGEAPGAPSAATQEMQSQITISGVKHISAACNSKPESQNRPMP